MLEQSPDVWVTRIQSIPSSSEHSDRPMRIQGKPGADGAVEIAYAIDKEQQGMAMRRRQHVD